MECRVCHCDLPAGTHGNTRYCAACKPEAYETTKAWRKVNAERLHAQRQRYSQTPGARAKARRDSASYKLRHPDKLSAQRKLQYAILTGKMQRGTECGMCGLVEIFEPGKRFRIHAHHTDYAKPYDVQWLCEICHAGVHNSRR